MADRSNRYAVLTRALLLAIVIAVAAPAPARAHNSWAGGYRKFPWKGSYDRTITTLPGECPHCPGVQSSSAWKAIDVGDMDYETVYAISPGTVDGMDLSGSGGAGIYLRIKDADGTFVTYEHLTQILVSTGAAVVAGQPIAVSGNTGNSTGPHLHFQRQSGTSFSSTALELRPISAHGGSGDPLAHTAYTSDNAGIGYSSGGTLHPPVQAAYKSRGGYSGFGVTADIGDAWSPCRDDTIVGTWWRYQCKPNATYNGSVQTFSLSSKARALMSVSSNAPAYVLTRGILGAYTEEYAGHDWVYWIGYPTSNRYAANADRTVYRQDFENGSIFIKPAACEETVYRGSVQKAVYGFCD